MTMPHYQCPFCNIKHSALCTVNPGYPQPKYRWFKDGVPLTREYSSDSHYRIHTRREDGGMYYCVAKNDVGSVFSERILFNVACKYNIMKFENLPISLVCV